MDSRWESSVSFHGHTCPGLALGFRAAHAALDALAAPRAVDEELVAVVETDACGVDALQVVTGCTLGKGNLIYRDHGKPVYTVGSRETGTAVRVVVDHTPGAEELASIRERIRAGKETPGDRDRLETLEAGLISTILHAPQEQFLKIERVELELPEAARIFPTLRCQRCGERVMEPRTRLEDGDVVCIPCHTRYTRGW